MLTFWGMFLFSVLCMSVSLNANPIYYTTYLPFIVPFVIWITEKSELLAKPFLGGTAGYHNSQYCQYYNSCGRLQ